MNAKKAKQSFNEVNIPQISDMKHIAIMNTTFIRAENLLNEFDTKFPIGNLVQPSHLGATFFHVNILHKNCPLPEVEKTIFKAIQSSIELDVILISDRDIGNTLKHIEMARTIAPEAQVILACRDSEKTIKEFQENGNLDVFGSDNIIPFNDVKYNLLNLTNMKATSYTGDKKNLYMHSCLLRDAYYEISGIKKAQTVISDQYQQHKELAGNLTTDI